MAENDRKQNYENTRDNKSKTKGDRLFMVTGFALAAAAALFPWYVFFNQDSFGVSPMDWGDTRDLPELPSASMVSVSPLAIPDEKDGSVAAQPFDPITTATVGDVTPDEGSLSLPGGDSGKTLPEAQRYKLLHVANGRALIEDSSGVYLLQVGSALPDNSKLATMEKRDGKWVIITSSGEVFSE